MAFKLYCKMRLDFRDGTLWTHVQNWWIGPLNLYFSGDVVGWFFR